MVVHLSMLAVHACVSPGPDILLETVPDTFSLVHDQVVFSSNVLYVHCKLRNVGELPLLEGIPMCTAAIAYPEVSVVMA